MKKSTQLYTLIGYHPPFNTVFLQNTLVLVALIITPTNLYFL